MTRSQEIVNAAVSAFAELAAPLAEKVGTVAIAQALTTLAFQLLVQTHPKREIAAWFRKTADDVEESGFPSAGGSA